MTALLITLSEFHTHTLNIPKPSVRCRCKIKKLPGKSYNPNNDRLSCCKWTFSSETTAGQNIKTSVRRHWRNIRAMRTSRAKVLQRRETWRGRPTRSSFPLQSICQFSRSGQKRNNWVVKRTRKWKLELRAHRGQGALGNTPVTLQNLKLRKEGNFSDTRKVIPDGSLAKQKGMKSNKKGG